MPPIVISDGDDLPSGCLKFDDMIADGIDDFEKIEKTGVGYQDTIFLPYSSGTTGLPKGVEISHKNIVSCIGQMSHEAINPTIEATKSYQDIIPVILPMFHIFALTLCVCKGLCYGAKLVCVPRFSTERFLQVLHKSRPTLIYVAPPIMQFLAYNDKVTRSHLESLRVIISGAASLSNECIKRFQNRAPSDLAIAQGYGLTETSPTLTLRKDSYQDINSTGFIIPNTQFRIVEYQKKKLGCNLGFDEVGEIYVRGPQIMKGYYKNPKATAESMDGDWFKTGDLGFVKNDGAVFITGRLKELIKVKGLQVSPLELEEVLQTHENITDVAVIGVENDRFGEIPMAFVVSKPGSKISEDDIKDFVAQRLTKHKHLGHVKFVQQIPKSSAGKILRKELRRIAT
ncbi:4-coumarate--CoA ligase 1 [Cephus cinctus]|uniref:4-coumarate--CoA ligase 1 n=1 Tax=Cephus cinctus TaxID=211228 RepID=A0AAJ7RAZ4_CEPCN|nr:4-coumarate--CoA ligase 1 [Cephus cinctus]